MALPLVDATWVPGYPSSYPGSKEFLSFCESLVCSVLKRFDLTDDFTILRTSQNCSKFSNTFKF
eukprot:2539575-Rhodomonas_salina.1